jgi:hypothetical protein
MASPDIRSLPSSASVRPGQGHNIRESAVTMATGTKPNSASASTGRSTWDAVVVGNGVGGSNRAPLAICTDAVLRGSKARARGEASR